ncbi:MAG: hypothetical protein ABJA71_13570 [Ginsengibacter sp.]
MYRFLIPLLVFNALISCSKKEAGSNPPVVIPDRIEGVITELDVTPINITTPDKGSFLISANNTSYKVDFNAVEQSQSNAELIFAYDTLLVNDSREFANLGKDAIGYSPLRANQITILIDSGRKVSGIFNPFTIFRGVFGQALISQWRDSNDPAKPNQKAKDDLTSFIERYSDKDGPGPNVTPTYLFVKVSKY